MNAKKNFLQFSNLQLTVLVILRMAIGWHFLYEGITKVMNPAWSSAAYLLDSKGWFEGIFFWMASNPVVLQIVDFLNVWGLTIIGFALVTGLFARIASVGGLILLAFYYLSHPPFIGADYIIPGEGNYFLVNKNLIEFFALWVVYLFPTSKITGLDYFIFRRSNL